MSLHSISTIGALVSAAYLAVGALSGCVVTNEETNPPAGQQAQTYPFPSQADFCLAKAKAECNSTVQKDCNTTVDACVTGRSAVAVCNPASLPYDPAPAQACLTALTSAWADGVLDHTDIVSNTKACTPVFTQKHVGGDICATPPAVAAASLPSAAIVGWEIGPDTECDTAAGYSCLIPAGKTSGACTKPTILGAGDDCSPAGSVCDDHLYCNSGTCAKAKQLGDPCTEEKLCDLQFVCRSGSCAARAPAGTACKADAQCAGKDGPTGFCIGDASGNNLQCFDTFQLTPFANSCESFK